ncbi:FeoB-associated Cys-rich membrane protein [Lysobacteraceae bacterium NML120232]|nr:FeoB-associated Cys-rich membrane protein [Xanthomonadaceae bacterium NML120232]
MSDTVQYLIVGAIVALCLGYMLRRLLARRKRGGSASGCARCNQCSDGKGCH